MQPTFDLDDSSTLFRADVLEDPRPLYAYLRREAPVWKLPNHHTYLVSDPALIRDIVARPEDFSSNLVAMVHRGADGVATAFEMLPLGDPGHVLAVADPPHHTRHRKLLQAHLSPAGVAWIEPAVRQMTAERIDAMTAVGHGDAVAQLADVVPAASLCHILGLPVGDADTLVPLVVRLGALLDGLADEAGMEQAGLAALELAEYAISQLERQRALAEDERRPLFNAVVTGIDLGEITDDEAMGLLLQLFTAGTETTQSLIATTIARLAVDQALQDRLRRDPEGIPDALEDILRDDGPFQFHYRWTARDTSVGPAALPANSQVLLMWSAANQRERPAAGGPPDSGRQPPHFAFGRGIHFCIGAALARLESRVVIEELLARTRRIELDPDLPPRRRPSIMLRRHASLPIRVLAG